jgi:DNA polymerase I-like protein with 3'-5' exonuclease and polymerase domains
MKNTPGNRVPPGEVQQREIPTRGPVRHSQQTNAEEGERALNLLPLLHRIRLSGGEVGWREGQVFLKFRSGLLTPEEAEALRLNEEELSRILRPKESDSESWPFRWSGEQLGPEVALDCETTLIQDFELPNLVLVSVSDGQRTFILKPGQLDQFLRLHRDRSFICHNAAFDFRVVEKYLRDSSLWWSIAESGRLHDTMILDQLIGLAESDEYPRPRNLGQVAKQWSGMELNKEDSFRTRYAELLRTDWSSVEEGFFTYAAKDAEATVRSWQKMKLAAGKFSSIRRFGLLTEQLQTLASIALADITANGMELDRELVVRNREAFADRIQELIDQLQQLPKAEGLFKQNRQKTFFLMNETSGKPSINQKRLREILQAIAEEKDLSPPSTGKTRELTTSVKWWSAYAEEDEFLKLWVQLEQTAKLTQFFAGLTERRIHPKYSTLVRTGRTSCSGPNIQQLPREGGFREMVTASPGTVLLTVDFAAIELRTLASVCEKTFGFSRLAEVFRQRVDPHSYTAAMFSGMELDHFLQLPKSLLKPLRQKAKALNFGIPGGLGAKSLVSYAKHSYGVDLTVEEAEDFRQKLIAVVYPELELYLREDAALILAENLQTERKLVDQYFPASVLGAAKNIVRGSVRKKDGEEYASTFVESVWNRLKGLNRNSELRFAIEHRKAGEALFRKLFWTPVETTTGRRRASVSFSQARNTPFQGLAADGAKLSLWRLYREGFRTVAFVHDEVVVELPEDSDHSAEAEKVVQLMVSSMAEVMDSDIPVEVEFSLSRRWWKNAEEVRSEDGQLLLWSPEVPVC